MTATDVPLVHVVVHVVALAPRVDERGLPRPAAPPRMAQGQASAALSRPRGCGCCTFAFFRPCASSPSAARAAGWTSTLKRRRRMSPRLGPRSYESALERASVPLLVPLS